MKPVLTKGVRTNAGRTSAALPRIAAVLVALTITVILGCSRTNEPESLGTISLKLHLEAPSPGGVAFSSFQLTIDSVVVRVFRGGTSVTHETSRGMAISSPGEVDMTVTCVAEPNKKVSVELFAGSTMSHFGVDEHVDVLENENTDVLIDAWDIYIDRVDVSPPTVVDGTAYNVSWSEAVAAASYLVVESTDPDFPPPFTESFLTTDTLMTFQRPPGAYYYVVTPLTPYTVGTLSGMAYTYVQAVGEQPPQVTGTKPSHAAPGDPVTIEGSNLDVPGRVLLNGVECPIVRASETELVFVVPLAAHTGAITLETLMGIVIPNPPVVVTVDRIAYVTTANGDQDGYVQLIRGEPSISSGVAVVPLDEVPDRDMRVFDIVVVAHDVANGPFTHGGAEIEAIANSGANVLAIGRGGQGYLALVFPLISGSAAPDTPPARALEILEPRPVFQVPESIPVQGVSTVEISADDQPFSSFEFEDAVPAEVTVYASLSNSPPNRVLFDIAAVDAFDRPLHNFFWGFEGNPIDLWPDSGQQLVINVLSFLESEKAASPAATDRPSP